MDTGDHSGESTDVAEPMCQKGFCGELAYCAEAGECLAVTSRRPQEATDV
jgi:hypothetical protein